MQHATFARPPRAQAHLSALGCTLATLVSSAPVVNATFGVFLLPISRELHWARAETTSLLSLAAACCAVCYPLAGRAADRFGARRVATIGNLLFSLAIASISLTGPHFLADMLLFAVLGATSAIPGGVVFSKIVAGWYDRRRGLVLGIVGGVGNGVGASVMPILVQDAVANWGWRAGYLALALVVFVVGQVSIAMLRDPEPVLRERSTPVAGLSLMQAVRTRRFASVLGLAALGAGALNAVFTHLVAMMSDRGLHAAFGAELMAIFALTGSVWQMAFGALLDRTGSPRIMAPVFLLAIPGLAILASATSGAGLCAGAVLAGLALGTEYAAIPYVVSRYFGLRAFATINGLVSGINAVVIGAAPMLVDVAFDRTGSYGAGIVAACIALAASAVIAARLPRFTATPPAARTA